MVKPVLLIRLPQTSQIKSSVFLVNFLVINPITLFFEEAIIDIHSLDMNDVFEDQDENEDKG